MITRGKHLVALNSKKNHEENRQNETNLNVTDSRSRYERIPTSEDASKGCLLVYINNG